MSDTLKLGQVIEAGRTAERDAVHVAVAPVTAAYRLSPGQPVYFTGDGDEVGCGVRETIGIVDPFLPGPVFKGDRFWMWLNPGSITSLRHDWTHPAFTAAVAQPHSSFAESKAWIEGFARREGLHYSDILKAAEAMHKEGNYYTLGTSVDVPAEFWDHYEVVTGEKVDPEDRSEYFSCSC